MGRSVVIGDAEGMPWAMDAWCDAAALLPVVSKTSGGAVLNGCVEGCI